MVLEADRACPKKRRIFGPSKFFAGRLDLCEQELAERTDAGAGHIGAGKHLNVRHHQIQQLWIGGESGPALRRTARVGDGWYPIGTNPTFPLDSLARYQAATTKLRGLAEKAGRDPSSITLAYRVARYGGPAALASDGNHQLFTGDNSQIAADIVALRDAGVTSLDIGFPGANAQAMLLEMQRFRDQVIAPTRS